MAELLYIEHGLATTNKTEADHWKDVARTLAEFVVNESECTEQYAKMVLRASRKKGTT